MSNLYHSETEYQQHAKAIHSIADQYHFSDDEIRVIYEDVLKKMKLHARCKQYLSVLVMRHVKEILHKAGNNPAAI